MNEHDRGKICGDERRFDIDLECLMRSPQHFPLRISLKDNALIFIEACEADYRRASFLDPRGFPTDARIWQASLSDLVGALGAAELRGRRCYLFHTGFCCSTLLSRCLEAFSDLFVLREPMSLHGIEGQIEGIGVDWPRARWNAALALLMGLLTRTWAAGQSSVIKSDCVLLFPTLLQSYPGPCIVLSCGLRDFIASVLSCPTRRAWASTRLSQMMKIAPSVDLQASFDLPTPPNPAEAAALLWWWQKRIFREAASAYPSVPMYFLSAESLLENPVAHLELALQTLGTPSRAQERGLSLDQILNRDAKDPERPGSAAQRAAKLAASHSLHGATIENAIRTASAWIGADVESGGRI
jgi:hypothetical protein